MTFSDAELRFLARQPRGHLATLGPNGTPQVKPLGFTYNPALGSIDITGFNMSGSAKYRNVQANPNVSFNVDPDHLGFAARDVPPADTGNPVA